MITLDTIRADYLSVYNPKGVYSTLFDKILKNGALFKNAFTPIPLTLPAHGSILTGKYPNRINLLVNGKGFLKSDFYLPKFFKERNYTTSAIVSLEELYARFLKYSDKVLKTPLFCGSISLIRIIIIYLQKNMKINIIIHIKKKKPMPLII